MTADDYNRFEGPGVERIRKNISKTFQQHGLQVTTEANMIETDFLDITLNLNSGKFWPYRKPNNQPLYIHAASNHPPIIKKHLPSMIAKRVSEISCNKGEFKKAIPLYNEALKNSGYASSLTFQQEQSKRKSRARKRNVIWFNPPYSDSVKTNVGKEFFRLLSEHFPSHHKLRKICNKNSVKLSYSCMPNVATIISSHNKALLRKEATQPDLQPATAHNLQLHTTNNLQLQRQIKLSPRRQMPGKIPCLQGNSTRKQQ